MATADCGSASAECRIVQYKIAIRAVAGYPGSIGNPFAMRSLFALLLLLPVTIGAAGETRAETTADAHIINVTQNIPDGLWGWTFGGKTLAERMQHYHATAVGIAVIDNYKIAWARGFGVTSPGSRTEVTDNTLFQAGSISKVLTAVGILRLVDSHAL